MKALHDALGARWGRIGGAEAPELPRSYGDARQEYDAAHSGAIVVDRADRALLRMFGRDPLRMIQGLVSNDVAGAAPDRAVYAAVLSPKGKMIADVRVVRRAADELLLELDLAARDALGAHLRKFVPPLFARFEDVSAERGVLGVYGPHARAAITDATGVHLPSEPFVERVHAGDAADALLVVQSAYTGVEGFEIIAARAALPGLWEALVQRGARPAGHATLEVLRIEAGTPRWGAELDESVIPLEAGLRARAISESKGCYTGQEVIVRILHRGHVNRHLRGLLLGDAPAPAQAAPLWRGGDARNVGQVTSACMSPRLGQTIALAYVRREVQPGENVQVGALDGPTATVVELPF